MLGLLLAEWAFEGDPLVLFNVNSWEKFMIIYLVRRKLMMSSCGCGVLIMFF
jgi:hypothetical protein